MTEEQEMAVESVRKFVQNEIEPEIRAHGESHFSKEQLVKWSSKLSEFGYISAPHPEESGGYGMDWKTHLLIWEEVAVGSLDLALTGLINVAGIDLLINNRFICHLHFEVSLI